MKRGDVYITSNGRKFVVDEVFKVDQAVSFYAVDTDVFLDGTYSAERLRSLIAAGMLKATGESFDIDAYRKPKVAAETARREQAAKERAAGEAAGPEQMRRMLGKPDSSRYAEYRKQGAGWLDPSKGYGGGK